MNHKYGVAGSTLSSLIVKYKSWIIGAVVAAILALGVFIVGAGYLIYKTAFVTLDKAKNWNSAEVSDQVNQISDQVNQKVSGSVAAVTGVIGSKAGVSGLPAEVAELPATAPGFVEGFIVGVASHWLNQGLASAEFASMKDGLACFDAIGGPSPSEMVNYAKSRTTDQAVLAKLKNLSSTLTPTTSSGPASCAQWILNG